MDRYSHPFKQDVECDTSNITSISLCKRRIPLLNSFLLIFACWGGMGAILISIKTMIERGDKRLQELHLNMK